MKKILKYADSFPGGPVGFLKLKERNIQYSTLRDLTSYRIGVCKGYNMTDEFDHADYLNKDMVVNDLINLDKLLKGRNDMFINDKHVVELLIDQNMPEEKHKIEFMEPALEVKDFYPGFSHKIDHQETLIAMFNQGLSEMIQDGTLTAIRQFHKLA